MNGLSLLRRMFVHGAWANQAAVAAVRAAGGPPEPLRLLAHIAGAERLWLSRLDRAAAPLAVWPSLTIDECATELAAVAAAWAERLAEWDDGALAATVSYVNSRGEPWISTVADVLTHVALHSSYHRGQIATAMRAAGAEPAYTDFIHAARTGSL